MFTSCHRYFAMTDLQSLKRDLQAAADGSFVSPDEKLADVDYDNSFALFTSPPNNKVYEDCIIPTMRETLAPLFDSRNAVSILEIEPGPKTVLASLLGNMQSKINRCTAFEPNVSSLEVGNKKNWPLPGLLDPAQIRRSLYELCEDETSPKYDLVLFCHSLYGMQPKRKFVEQALKSLGNVGGELVLIFHRDGCLDLSGLVCYRTASSPDSTVAIRDHDQDLTTFASFGSGIPTTVVDPDVRLDWRNVCRSRGSSDPTLPGQLIFHAPEIMLAFNEYAGALQALTARVPVATSPQSIKNREACDVVYADIVAPTDVEQVQTCVQWALKHRMNLTIIGGSHSGHCVQPNIVAVDMSCFYKVHVTDTRNPIDDDNSTQSPLITVGSGCTTGDIIETATKAGLTVPLGSRPSVGIELRLLGGVGHLSRQHGLACDSIVGAVLVSVETGEVLRSSDISQAHCPKDAIRPENETDLL